MRIGRKQIMLDTSWQELSNPRDLAKIFSTPEYAAWRSLRDSEDSKYLGLAMPRFLARQPYGAKSDPVEEFDFEGKTLICTHEDGREVHIPSQSLSLVSKLQLFFSPKFFRSFPDDWSEDGLSNREEDDGHDEREWIDPEAR